MKNVWEKLKKPVIIQAPMENITDSPFRQMISLCGKPDLFFTEFVSTDGLISPGRRRVIKMLTFSPAEKPIIAQIWGNTPDKYRKSGVIVRKMGFDGIDINLGCPDRGVVAKGFCSALINNKQLVKKLFLAAKESAYPLPVSIKTRLGYDKIETENWIGFLLSLKPSAITIHGRTARQKSKGESNWEEIGKAVDLRNRMKSETLIIGNGDVMSLKEAREKYNLFKTDGVMIGRGILHNIWIFNPGINHEKVSVSERIALLIKHIGLFESTWGKTKNFRIMKKYYRIYISGFEGAGNLRINLMKLNSAGETADYLREYSELLPK